MSNYDGIVQVARTLGSQAGRRGTAANPNSQYPWLVKNQKTAGAIWAQPDDYTKRLRSYANQGIQQYTENPTAYTPELEKTVISQYIDTTNAQADKAANQFRTHMARTGLAGQPVTAAHQAQLDYQRGKDIAGKVTDTRNQFAVQRQEDYKDWLDRINQLNTQDRQLKLSRDQMAMQMAQFNASRQDAKQQSTLSRIMPWIKPAAGLISALGSNMIGQNGGN